MHFCWSFIYLVSSYSTLCCVMACETYVRLLKSIKVQSFKIVKPCPQTPSLQDHALEPGPRLAAMSGPCLCPGTGSRSARTAPPSPAQAPVWSEAGAIPNITDPWGPYPDIDRIDEAGSSPSSLVQYPICCVVSICISRSQALCTVHMASVPRKSLRPLVAKPLSESFWKLLTSLGSGFLNINSLPSLPDSFSVMLAQVPHCQALAPNP